MNDSPTNSDARRIVVIGGGISGIAAALRIADRAPAARLTLLEASDRLGGVLDTVQRDGFLVERAADMFTTKMPWASDLCAETDYDDLIPVNPEHRRAFLIRRGRLTPVPEGFALLKPVKLTKMMLSPLLSVRGKLRLLGERRVPRRKEEGDESLASFARRRLGREVYERLVQPLIGGIYTADPELLSMQATLPQFPEMERQHGSLIRAALRDSDASDKLASGARYDQFVAPRQGFRHWIDHLAARLPAGTIRTAAPVAELARTEQQWQIVLRDGSTLAGDDVLLATPAHQSAKLLRKVDGQLADQLAAIPYAGSSVVIVACRRDQLSDPLQGFGVVAPLVEKRRVLAISYASVKFAKRAPEDSVLLRVFVGGAVQPELNALDDAATCDLVRSELEDLLGLRGDPLWMDVVRWTEAMPQYHVGHVQRVERIKRLADAHPGLCLAGAAYRGVGIPFCVRSGRAAADRICGD